jgi:hypothetical protein
VDDNGGGFLISAIADWWAIHYRPMPDNFSALSSLHLIQGVSFGMEVV